MLTYSSEVKVQFKRQVSKNIDTSKSIDYKDDFELVAIRWKYFLKSPNPTTDRLKQLKPMVNKISKENWNKFKNVYSIVGYDLDDITNIALCHAVNFLGNFSIEENNEVKREQFINVYKNRNGEDTYPTDKDFKLKNLYNLSKFLVQRMEEVAKVCYQKNRSIRGTGETFKIFSSKNPVEVEDRTLIEHKGSYGYKEITKKKYKELKKKNNIKNDENFYDGKTYIRVVSLAAKNIGTEDFLDSYIRNNSSYYKAPDELIQMNEEKSFLTEYREKFESFTKNEKKKLIKDFIDNNKNNIYVKEELFAAREFLKGI